LSLSTAATAIGGDGPLRDMGLVVMACVAMLLAAFAPLMLLRHAPVIPGTGTSRHSQDSMSAAGGGRQSMGRGGSQAVQHGKAGVSKLNAMAAARSKDKAPTPPPGRDAGPGRSIDPPIPPSGASGTASAGPSAPRTGRRATDRRKPAPANTPPSTPGRPSAPSRPAAPGTTRPPGRTRPTAKSVPRAARQVPDHEYTPPSEPPAEES
jgi:hypothetical protein